MLYKGRHTIGTRHRRLRRAVLHPNLVLSSDDEGIKASSKGAIDVDALVKQFGEGNDSASDNKVYAEGVLANLEGEEGQECPICFDVMDTPTIIPNCLHQRCVVCPLTSCTPPDITEAVRTASWPSLRLAERRMRMSDVRYALAVPSRFAELSMARVDTHLQYRRAIS